MKPITIAIMATLSILTACSSSNPIPPISSTITDSNAITAENASALVEMESLSQNDAGPVTALVFTSDHSQLRVVHARIPMLAHWDLLTGKLLAQYELDSVGLGAAVFDRNADQVVLSGTTNIFALSDEYLTGISPEQVTGPKDGVYVLDAEGGQLLNYLNPAGYRGEFRGVAFSQDGRTVATQGYNTTDKAYELLVFKRGADSPAPFPIVFNTPHAQNDYGVDFALDAEGRLLAEYAGNNSIQLWDLNSEKEWGALKIETKQSDKESQHVVVQLAIAPTRQWMAGFSETDKGSRYITVWRLDEKSVQSQVEVSDIYVNAFAFNPSGDLLAIAANDGLHLWNAATGEEIMNYPGESVFAVTFSQDGALLAWGDKSGTVHLAGLPKK